MYCVKLEDNFTHNLRNSIYICLKIYICMFIYNCICIYVFYICIYNIFIYVFISHDLEKIHINSEILWVFVLLFQLKIPSIELLIKCAKFEVSSCHSTSLTLNCKICNTDISELFRFCWKDIAEIFRRFRSVWRLYKLFWTPWNMWISSISS